MGVRLNSSGTHLKNDAVFEAVFCNMALPHITKLLQKINAKLFCYNFFRNSRRVVLKLHSDILWWHALASEDSQYNYPMGTCSKGFKQSVLSVFPSVGQCCMRPQCTFLPMQTPFLP